MKKNNYFDVESSGYIFALPALIFMIVFIGYPIIYNLILSFQNVNVFTFSDKNKPFIGFENFISLFKNSILNLTILNTLIYTICCITFQFIFGFLLAIFFNNKFYLSEKLRACIMIAWLIPITITGLLFKFMFSTSGGIFNEALLYFHLINKPIEWLLQPVTAMISLIITNIWIGVPFNMILILTGLTTIPDEIYESSDIDGASKFQKMIFITIPMLKPAIKAVLILGFIYTFKVFDLVYVMTKGGPVNATEVLSTFAYRLSFTEFNFSKGSAVATILFVILFIISIRYVKLIGKEEVM